MAENCVPFQLVPLGGGVTRVIASGTLCTHCHGKGFLPAEGKTIPHIFEDIKALERDEDHGPCGENCSCENGCSQGGSCCKHHHHAA